MKPEPLVLSALATALALGACTPRHDPTSDSSASPMPTGSESPHASGLSGHGAAFIGGGSYAARAQMDERRREQERVKQEEAEEAQRQAAQRAADESGTTGADSQSDGESGGQSNESFGSHGSSGDAGG